jgi:hypothetical protein
MCSNPCSASRFPSKPFIMIYELCYSGTIRRIIVSYRIYSTPFRCTNFPILYKLIIITDRYPIKTSGSFYTICIVICGLYSKCTSYTVWFKRIELCFITKEVFSLPTRLRLIFSFYIIWIIILYAIA